MLPRAVTDSHHKKRASQNVAALGVLLKVTTLHKKKEESTKVLNSQGHSVWCMPSRRFMT